MNTTAQVKLRVDRTRTGAIIGVLDDRAARWDVPARSCWTSQ
jgi:hypothetical protein